MDKKENRFYREAQQPAAQAAGLTDDIYSRLHEIAYRDSAVSVTVRVADLRALLSRAAPSGEHAEQSVRRICRHCGTHEIELIRVCHNSSCSAYAAEESVFKGWEPAPRVANGQTDDDTDTKAALMFVADYSDDPDSRADAINGFFAGAKHVRGLLFAPQPSAHPVAWVRFRSDGGIEGPILDTDPRMDDVRRKSGAWTALGVITPQPSAQQAEQVANQNAAFTAAIRRAEKANPAARAAIIWNAALDCAAEQPAEEARGVYGHFEVAFMGAGVWAGIPDELPSELVGKKVWLSLTASAAGTGQEPVAWRKRGVVGAWDYVTKDPSVPKAAYDIGDAEWLYTAPQVATGAQGLTAAARDVLAERQRQIEVEGWTPEHDDEHTHASMAQAAACYALFAAGYSSETVLADWPWDPQWWKPSDDPRRNLEKAGALTLAEIERLDRAALAASKEGA